MRNDQLLPLTRATIAIALATLTIAAAAPSTAADMEIPFTLSKPAGDGPFPAVVILHDCSGLGPRSSGAPWRWSSELARRGYVTIWPDSFSTRGHPAGVCTDATPPRIRPEQRAADALAALKHLQALPFIDHKRVAVMGGSHGGSSALASIVDQGDGIVSTKEEFAAAIALYPACGRSYGTWKVERATTPGAPVSSYSGVFKPRAPLLILTGALDDWTPAEHCRRLIEAAQQAGHPVEIIVYPGAHHSFDSVSPVRYIAERINPNSSTGRGATTGGNAEAWKDAIMRVEQFLGRHLSAAR
jgi:dienelactone hydrolase